MAKKQTVKLKEKHEEELKQLRVKNKKAKKKAEVKQSLKDREQSMRMISRVVGEQIQSAKMAVVSALRASHLAHLGAKSAQQEHQHSELMMQATKNKEQLRQLTLQNAMLKKEHENWVSERERLKQDMLAAQCELQSNYALGRLRFMFKQFASDTSMKKDTVSMWRINYQRAMYTRAEMLAAQVAILKQQLQIKTEGRVVKRTAETASSCESRLHGRCRRRLPAHTPSKELFRARAAPSSPTSCGPGAT